MCSSSERLLYTEFNSIQCYGLADLFANLDIFAIPPFGRLQNAINRINSLKRSFNKLNQIFLIL